jgi:hypothetical protein
MNMDDSALTLDGNAIAGLLAVVFNGAEVTTALRGCGSCGQRHPIGAHRLYRGPGFVLRCPGCDDVALTLIEADGHRALRLTGTWSIRTPAVADA